jgi:hypothetical protein
MPYSIKHQRQQVLVQQEPSSGQLQSLDIAHISVCPHSVTRTSYTHTQGSKYSPSSHTVFNI